MPCHASANGSSRPSSPPAPRAPRSRQPRSTPTACRPPTSAPARPTTATRPAGTPTRSPSGPTASRTRPSTSRSTASSTTGRARPEPQPADADRAGHQHLPGLRPQPRRSCRLRLRAPLPLPGARERDRQRVRHAHQPRRAAQRCPPHHAADPGGRYEPHQRLARGRLGLRPVRQDDAVQPGGQRLEHGRDLPGPGRVRRRLPGPDRSVRHARSGWLRGHAHQQQGQPAARRGHRQLVGVDRPDEQQLGEQGDQAAPTGSSTSSSRTIRTT